MIVDLISDKKQQMKKWGGSNYQEEIDHNENSFNDNEDEYVDDPNPEYFEDICHHDGDSHDKYDESVNDPNPEEFEDVGHHD